MDSQCQPGEVEGAEEADPGVAGLPIKMCHFFPFFDFAFGLGSKELSACAHKDARTVSARWTWINQKREVMLKAELGGMTIKTPKSNFSDLVKFLKQIAKLEISENCLCAK